MERFYFLRFAQINLSYFSGCCIFVQSWNWTERHCGTVAGNAIHQTHSLTHTYTLSLRFSWLEWYLGLELRKLAKVLNMCWIDRFHLFHCWFSHRINSSNFTILVLVAHFQGYVAGAGGRGDGGNGWYMACQHYLTSNEFRLVCIQKFA